MQGYLLVLYLGGAFYYAFTYKRMEDGATLGLYAFLYLFGGILFHLISETKSQYTLPYIYLQIPMIAAGYNHMTQTLSRYLKNMQKKFQKIFVYPKNAVSLHREMSVPWPSG